MQRSTVHNGLDIYGEIVYSWAGDGDVPGGKYRMVEIQDLEVIPTGGKDDIALMLTPEAIQELEDVLLERGE